MKRKHILIVFSVLIVIIAAVFILKYPGENSSENGYIVNKGELLSTIDCVGEIKGAKSTLIKMPEALRDFQLRVYNYKIIDIIQEGKTVSAGDYIAKLDEAELASNMRNKMKEKERSVADLRNAVLDSTVNLTEIREDIKNLQMDLEYTRIDLDQSKFESGTEQRKAQMNFQKAEIALERKRRDYLLQKNKLKTRIGRYESRVERYTKSIADYMEAIKATRITSTEAGIVMFENYHGQKISKGSTMQIFGETPIATLPDMSTAITLSFLKEIDMPKVHLNDSAIIKVDALPKKTFTGKITKIANMGEENKNFDMKAFKVHIQFDYSDPALKPGMTCNSTIVYSHQKDKLIVPINAIFQENNKSFVYLKNGSIKEKQLVTTGAEDEINVEILEGLKEGDKILINKTNKE